MAEPGAADAAAIAYELGRAVCELRVERCWSQRELAKTAHMTQAAVARFEAGDTVPSLPVLLRIADAIDANLTVAVTSRHHAA